MATTPCNQQLGAKLTNTCHDFGSKELLGVFSQHKVYYQLFPSNVLSLAVVTVIEKQLPRGGTQSESRSHLVSCIIYIKRHRFSMA